jgi:hypothetical protein
MAEFFDTKALLKQQRDMEEQFLGMPKSAAKAEMIGDALQTALAPATLPMRVIKSVAGGQLFAKLVKQMGAEQFKTVSKPWAKVMMELLRTPQKELSRVSKIEPAWAREFRAPTVRGNYSYPSRVVKLNIQKPMAVSKGKTLTHELTHARQYTPDPVPQDVARGDIIKEMGRLVRKSGLEKPRSAILDPSEIHARKMSEYAMNFPAKRMDPKLYDELYRAAFDEALVKGVKESLPEAQVDPRVTKALLTEFKRMFQRTPK